MIASRQKAESKLYFRTVVAESRGIQQSERFDWLELLGMDVDADDEVKIVDAWCTHFMYLFCSHLCLALSPPP